MNRTLGALLMTWAGLVCAQATPPIPAVEGPITAGGEMSPGLRPLAPGTAP